MAPGQFSLQSVRVEWQGTGQMAWLAIDAAGAVSYRGPQGQAVQAGSLDRSDVEQWLSVSGAQPGADRNAVTDELHDLLRAAAEGRLGSFTPRHLKSRGMSTSIGSTPSARSAGAAGLFIVVPVVLGLGIWMLGLVVFFRRLRQSEPVAAAEAVMAVESREEAGREATT
jgi:hypothetical protein